MSRAGTQAMHQTLLSGLSEMRQYLPRLQALGIDTLEQLQGSGQAASIEMQAYLGTGVDALISAAGVEIQAIPADDLELIQAGDYPLGVELDMVPRPTTAPPLSIAAEPAKGNCANLFAQMAAIRDQGNRGTCVAHAAVAAFEQFLGSAGASHDLSEQFLYWNCKRTDGIPNTSGTWLGVAMPLLHRDGCCLESDWAYAPNPLPGNEGQGPPPPGTQLKALAFRSPSVRPIASASPADYRSELLAGSAVAFSIPVFNSWYASKNVAYTGDITLPIPGEVRAGGHAMCIVGCIDLPDRPELGGGRFILRNSWGARWGIVSPYAAGYGTIPYRYIARFGTEAYSVR